MRKGGLKIKGTFKCKVFENGVLIQEYSDKNLVVDIGKTRLLQMMKGDISFIPISKIGFGTNSTTPTAGDMNLLGQVFEKNLTGSSLISDTEIQFNWFLGSGEANGSTLREFGLKYFDGQLFARKVGLNVAKTNLITLTGEWVLELV